MKNQTAPFTVKPNINATGVRPVEVFHILDATGAKIASFSNFSNLTGEPLPAEENARIAAAALNEAHSPEDVAKVPAPGTTVHRINSDGTTAEYVAGAN